MLRELITWVLNTYLGKYLEDFNPAQLSVALLSGEVELENVPIRKDALRSFGLPVQAVSGVIGKIKLQIPVRQFKTAPWCIVIEKVYVVFSPKDPNEWDDEVERLAELKYKMSELDTKEAVWRAHKGYQQTGSFYYATSYTNWLNYGTALATNIVENLELKIIDVHIRYEDSFTVPTFKFVAGITIDSLTVQSCDSKWSLGSKTPTEKDIAYKLIELSNFAVYWDQMTDENSCCNLASKELLERMNVLCDNKNHDYIIKPISARSQCKRERCRLPLRTRARPRLSCTVVVTEVDVSLSNFQYQQILGCLSGLQNIKKIRMCKILRPCNEIFGHAKNWWQYAAHCYGFKFETNAEKWQKLRENLRYINLYQRLLLNSSESMSKEEKEFKSYVERIRTLSELHIMRNVCFNNADTPDLNLQSQHINQGKSMLFHWFPNWWGWYGSSSTDVNQTQLQSVADEEIYQNIEDDILNALEDSVENNSYLKRDMVFGYFDFKLSSGKLSISEQNSLSSETAVMEMNFQNLNLMIESRPRSGSHLIGLSMGSVCVVDRLTTGTEFPDLVKPQMKEITCLQNSAASNLIIKQHFMPRTGSDSTSETPIFDPWFQLQYEKRPISYNTDFRLLIKSKSLDIVYNTEALHWIINFFTCPLNVFNTNKGFAERKKLAKPLFFKNWKNLLMENLEMRKTWSFEIDISAPQILFVDNFSDKNSSIVLVDFGRFQLLKNYIETKLKEPKVSTKNDKNESEMDVENDDEDDMFLTPCSTPPGSESSPLESLTQNFAVSNASKLLINNDTGLESAFHNKIYDKYIIDLTDLQVLLCKNRERNFASLKGSSIFHLLDKFSISLKLERRIIHTLDPEYPSLTLFGTLPRLVVHVNDQKINAIMSMLELVSTKSANETRKSQSENYLSKKEEELSNSNENITRIHSNVIILQFVIDQMTLEVQSQDRSIAELQVIGVRAGLNKKSEETNVNLSVHGLLLVDAIQSFGPDFELLIASHRHVGMDSISGSLKQSEPCSPTSPASPDPMVFKRPTSPHTISKAINSLHSGTPNTLAHREDMDALITVDINYIKEAPDGDLLQIANINFNNLDIIANQETFAELLGFVNRIEFINKCQRTAYNGGAGKESENEIQADRLSSDNFQLRTEVSFDFHRLNILVLRALKKDNFCLGRKVGTFTMSEAKIHATFGRDISVTGSLGGLQILDVTPEGINHQRIFSVGKDPLTDPPVLSRKNLLSSLAQEIYGAPLKEKDNQKDALMFNIARNSNCSISMKIRMASVWYTHCARFIQEISWCASQFKHYFKNFARSIRNKAADMAIEFVQQIDDSANITEDVSNVKSNFKSGKTKGRKRKLGSNIKINLDIILNSPVLVVPRSSQSTEVLVANLGKISIGNAENKNSLQPTVDKRDCNENISLLFSYFVDVRNINLFSLDTSRRKELTLSALPRAEEFYSCKNDAVAILHDTAIQLIFSNYSEKLKDLIDIETDNFEFLSIEGSVTQLLKVSLSREQYEQLLESFDNALKVPSEFVASFTTTSPNLREAVLKERGSNQNINVVKSNNAERSNCVKAMFSLPLFVIALNNEHNNPLVEITFLEFSINYNKKINNQIDLQVLLRSILMEDLKCMIDSRHRHMVDSTPCKEFKGIKRNSYISLSCPDLVSLQNRNKYSRSIPDNLQSLDEINVVSEILRNKPNTTANQYLCSEKTQDAFNKNLSEVCDDNLVAYVAQITYPQSTFSNCDKYTSSSVDFNSLNLIISVERWSMVLDFFGLLTEKETEDNDKKHFKQANINDEAKENSDLKMSVRSLNLTFVRNEVELAKANVSNASFMIKKDNDAKIIEGRLGSISLLDLTTFGKLYREKFLTSGSEALNFHYKRPSQIKNKRSLEKDAILQIQMSSVRYIHTKRFVMEIQCFVQELLQLQTPVIKKMKLSDTEKSINDRPTQMGLEIRAESPIILLPICYESNKLIIANLGEFTLINEFHSATDEIVKSKKCSDNPITEIIDVMQIDLVKINLFTAERILKSNKNENNEPDFCFDIGSFSIFKRGSNLLKDKCYLKLQVERNMDSNNSHNFPDVSVNGTLSKISCVLNLQQYKLIKGFLAHNVGEDIDDIYKNPSFSISESISKINSALKVRKKKNESSTWNVLSIKMELEDVAVYLNVESINRLEAMTLACINFIKSFLEIDCYSDGAQDIDLVSSEILVTDARYSQSNSLDKQLPNNVFTEVLKPIKSNLSNIVQAEIHSRKRSDCTKYTILLNNMRIMAILDWMESMKDYLGEKTSSPFSETHPQNKIRTKSQHSSEDVDVSTYEIILNITDSELVLVEKTNQCDTSAIILKSTTVFSYKPYDLNHPISINLNHLEVFSCIFGFENESALSIIDPVTLNIEVRNNKLDITLQKQLCIRLSYHDVKMFTKMLESIPKQTRTAQAKKMTKKYTNIDIESIAPLIAMGFNPQDCLYAMEISNYKLNEAAIWLTQQKQVELGTKYLEISSVVVSAQCISIYVIDDCKDADVPLLEISLSRLSFVQLLKVNSEGVVLNSLSSPSGQMEAIIGTDYYNRRLSGWEPVIEPWECMVNWKFNTDFNSTNNRFLNVEIKSKQFLKLNITSTLIELCKLVRNNWTQDYYEGTSHVSSNETPQFLSNYRRRTPFIPFALRNQTGEILRFKIILAQPGGITRTEIVQRNFVNDWITVKPDETVPFSFGLQNKLRHMDSHRLDLHQIIVEINGWTTVGPISIDKVGVFLRYSTTEDYIRRTRIVFDITLVGSAQKLITVRSALRVLNKLSKNVLLNIGIREDEYTYTVKPKEYFSIPLRKIDSLIYIKPSDGLSHFENAEVTRGNNNAQFGFCSHGISWSSCINDLDQELCVCLGQNNIPFNILVSIKRDKYPNRDVIHIPGHTITLYTPLTITNMLCCDLLFKISGHKQGRIHTSEKAYIHDVNIYDGINISLTIDNYTVYGQLRVPANHTGIVEPKLKLLDVNNRPLYLRTSIQSLSGKGMEIFISAPVWLINKTGLPLIYRQEGVSHIASGQFEENENARYLAPLMFSFTDLDASPSLTIRLGMRYGENNPWCKSFSLHKDIIHRQLQADDLKGNYAVGIEIRRGRGRYSCTNVVTLSPRFQLYNRSSHELQFAQKCDVYNQETPISNNKMLAAVSGCHFSFHWPNCDQEPLLCVRLIDIECCQWSSGIPINEAQSLYLNIRNAFGEMFFLRLEVILQGATYFLLFGDAHTLPPPIRIDNHSEVQINFFQHGYRSQWSTSVRPCSSLAYALDDPIGKESLQIVAPGGNAIDFPLHKIELFKSLTYSNFIYIAFKETFIVKSPSESNSSSNEMEIEKQNLVLGVKDKKVIIMKKCTGDRSQLWLMNSSGQLEHEGSSPPIEPGKGVYPSESRMVLDVEKPPDPMNYTNCVIRPPNKQRETTQTWRFENGRLMCHANMCVQAKHGVFGLHSGADAVLGRMESESRTLSSNLIPIEQCIERQKLRPGSGHLEVKSLMDGPILTIQIRDVKNNLEDESLYPDPLWKHTSTLVKNSYNSLESKSIDGFSVKLDLVKGIGISVISRHPCEELIYLTLQNLTFDFHSNPSTKSIEFKVSDIQIDNQLLDTSCPVLLYTAKSSHDEIDSSALILNVKILPSLNENAVIVENISLDLKPYVVILEERLLLKIALFLGFGVVSDLPANIESEYEAHYFEKNILSTNSKRYYFENLLIGACQIRLSVLTSTKLPPQLSEIKKSIGLTLIKFEDAVIEFEKFSDKHHFETVDVYLRAIKIHYKNQIKWHAGSILGSVDFLGNPLGFANDLSEGVSGLIFEGSVRSLVKNVTHGISNSTAKLTETLSDSLGRVVLDERDNEARQKVLEISSGLNTSTEHLIAGFKGLGFGLLGGAISIVRHTYAGAQTDGLHGFISGFGKGLVGTVTKPIIGVLDLASETANAVRETSKGSHRILPDRKRLPRCVTGAPGGLLPAYSFRQSKGQQYLYIINRRNLSEQLISYEPNLCNENDAKLRLLVSTEYVRIFSRYEEDTSIVLECHLSEVLSCHPLTANIGNPSSSTKQASQYYIEISTNLPKITRPRIRCQNEEIAERAARYINYAKSVFDEREQTVVND